MWKQMSTEIPSGRSFFYKNLNGIVNYLSDAIFPGFKQLRFIFN